MAREFVVPHVPSNEFDTPVALTEQDRKVMPFGFLETYREMGWKNFNRAQYEAATRNFNITMGLFPDDRRTVIGRGFSRSKNMLFEGALEDAQAILNQNEYDKEAIYLEALSQYELGNFEKALLSFNKGMNKRGKRPEFRDGRYQAVGTIENCIGRYSGPMLTDMKPVIKKMYEKFEKDRLAKEKESIYNDDLDIPPPHPCTDYEWNRYCRQQEQLKSVMAEMYLGKLNSDRKWFVGALDNPNLKSANKKGSEKLQRLSEKALDDIIKRQEILNSRSPLYHIRHQIELAGDGYKKQKRKMEEDISVELKVVTENLLRQIKDQRTLKNTKRCLDIAFRTKSYLDKAHKRLLPERDSYLEILYNLVGLVFLDLKKFKLDLSERHNYQRIVCLLGFDREFNEENIDPIVQESIFPFANYKKDLKLAEKILEVATTDLERAWLYYEIGRCYGEQQKWEYMVNRGKKCVTAAKRCDNLVWIINGTFMAVTGEMRDKNKEESIFLLNECLEYAYKYQDESVIKFLLTCKRVLMEKEVKEALLDSNTMLVKKEDFIINLIGNLDLKTKAADLFRRMRNLSAVRRMSVVPGIIPKDPHGFSSARMSIIPGGTGGRLSMFEPCKTTYKEFIEE